MPTRMRLIAILAGSSWFLWAASMAVSRDSDAPVGQVAAVEGRVVAAHAGETRSVTLGVPDVVRLHDVIQTDARSKSKILLQDDTLLTIGDKSLVEFAEGALTGLDSRIVTLKLQQGKVRALAGRVFANQGATFIVRTPTAFAAAQGTYLVVWTDGASSGAANIGTGGQVAFTSGNRTVLLKPGEFSMATADLGPVSPASLSPVPPAAIYQVLTATEFKESALPESAKDVLRSLARRPDPMLRPPWQTLAVPHTPPAVISGAAPFPTAPSTNGTGRVTAPSPSGAPSPSPSTSSSTASVLPPPAPVAPPPPPPPPPPPVIK